MIAGVDEVGRGPLAGPVIAAAVIMTKPLAGLKDSKLLSPRQRQALALQIQAQADAYAFGRVEVEEIEALNIHQASLLAMRRAVLALPIPPKLVLVDGLYPPQLDMDCQAFVGGDKTVYQISAASIIAKVSRDAEMLHWDSIYPGYGFAQHTGYPTSAHRDARKNIGPCPIHRRGFKGV